MGFKPLTRAEIKSVIEGRGAAGRVPAAINFWTDVNVFDGRKQDAVELFCKYPDDIQTMYIRHPKPYVAPEDDPGYRWVQFSDPNAGKVTGIDDASAIEDWSQLDGILADFPNPYYSGMFPDNPAEDSRYRLGCFGYCLFERLWSLRGMKNALMDFYTDPESVHRLFRALTDFYKIMIERAKNELKLDGIFTTDDIGTQTAPFFSPAIFKEFFRPYYNELIEKAHSLGMHFWLHTCGNIELFLTDFIEIGLDVIHPIQKYTMDESRIAERYGKDICLWAGFDVQRIIPWGTPDEVRQEVRFMIDTYFRPEGRFMLTAGNGIKGDCRIESLEALLDETYKYGQAKAAGKEGTP